MESINQLLPQTLQGLRSSASPSLMQKSDSVSVFRSLPPATDNYIAQWAATLSAAFPAQKPEFWTIVCKIVRKDGLSKHRLAYIAETLCRTWHYPTLQIADIISIDQTIKIWSYDEFYRHFKTTAVAGYCIIKERDASGRIQFCAIGDAEKAGIEILRKC